MQISYSLRKINEVQRYDKEIFYYKDMTYCVIMIVTKKFEFVLKTQMMADGCRNVFKVTKYRKKN